MKGGIASRLAIYTSLVALVATATVGYMVYRGAERSLMRSAADGVSHTAEVVRVRILANLEGIGNDVRFLAETPPVQGIVRARLRRGLDPETAIRDDEWGVQLAEIFRAFLISRASYVQARFIGLENDGLELVRVERTDGDVVFAPADSLERRADADYFKETAALPRGGIYVSGIRWGGEGRLPDDIPVMYVATPVYSREGQLFGIVIVSVDFRRELLPLQPLINPNQTLYVSGEAGRILLAAGANAEPNITRMQDAFGPTTALVQGEETEMRLLRADLPDRSKGIAYFGLLAVSGGPTPSRLFIGVTEPHDTIFAGVRRVRNQSALITLMLCLAAIIVALGIAQYVTQPIRQITRAVSSFGEDGHQVPLPIQRNDEIGVLARAFEAMEKQIEEQMRELEEERGSLRELSATLEERVHQRTADLEQVNVELQSSNRELRDIANVASHDLQEPLRKLRSFADLLQSEHGHRLDDEGRFYVQRIYRLAERMSHLISDLLAFSRIAGQDRPFQQVDLDDAVQYAIAGLEDTIAESGADIEVHELPVIDADPVEMRVLMENLLSNAIKYRKSDVPPKIEVRAIIDDGDNPICRLEVVDNGRGFDEKYVDRIFTPFERLHDGRSPGGTGMGLAICRRIAENHKGTIAAHSRVGEGSTFIVTLPLRQSSRLESENEMAEMEDGR